MEARRGIKLQFEIERTTVKLVADSGIKELASVVGKDFQPGLLVQVLLFINQGTCQERNHDWIS
jgi:hypothetical protein